MRANFGHDLSSRQTKGGSDRQTKGCRDFVYCRLPQMHRWPAVVWVTAAELLGITWSNDASTKAKSYIVMSSKISRGVVVDFLFPV